MLSEATFDQLVELPGVGPTRADTFLQLREEARGEVTGSWLIHEKLFSRVRMQMWACWAGWDIRVIWNGEMLMGSYCVKKFSRFEENEPGLS